MKEQIDRDDALRAFFEEIYRDTTNAFESAVRDGKKLIILLGESHEGGLSLVSEVMFICLAYHLGIKNVCVELDEKNYEVMKENNGLIKRTATSYMPFFQITEPVWISSTPVFQITRKFEMNMVPVDSTVSERADNTTAEMIVKSNKVMSKSVNELNDHALHIVGLMHLPGMLCDYPLDSQKFHVMTYNICCNHQIIKDSIASTEKRLLDGNHFFMSKEQSEFSLPLLHYLDCAKNIRHLPCSLQQDALRNLSRNQIVKLGLKIYTRYFDEKSEVVARPK